MNRRVGQHAVREAADPALDLRLAAPAAAAWFAAVLVPSLSPGAAARSGVTGAVLALALLALALLAGRGRRPLRVRLARATPAGALCLAVAAAVLGSAAAQQHATAQGLLPDAVRDQGTVHLVATVVGDPRVQVPPWPGAPARTTVVVDALRVTSRGRTGGAAGQVLVMGPADWAHVPYRSRVEVTGRVAAASPGGRVVAVLTTSAPPVVVRAPPAWARTTSDVRARVLALADAQPGDAGALLAGIVVGDTSRVPADLASALRTAGLTHVTAVSGAHFALVVAIVLATTTAARAPRPVRVAAALLATAGTVALVHPDPSVLRAAAMGLVAVVGLVVGRRAQAPAALATSVVVLLVVDPWLATRLGFVLSVLATAGLVLVGRPLAERWSTRLGRPAAEALALPVAAQLCCAPVLLLVAPSVATYAVPANMVAAPAVGPATVLGLLAGLVQPVCPPVAHVLAACAGAACWWVGAVARAASAAPGARADWLPGAGGVLALVVATAAVLVLLLRRPTR